MSSYSAVTSNMIDNRLDKSFPALPDNFLRRPGGFLPGGMYFTASSDNSSGPCESSSVWSTCGTMFSGLCLYVDGIYYNRGTFAMAQGFVEDFFEC